MSAADEGELFLYEEIMLLYLGNKTGTISVDFTPQIVAGAIVGELLLAKRISVENSPNKLVTLDDKTPIGDAILDECLRKIAWTKRRTSLRSWVSQFAGNDGLRHRIARRLCDRGILRADEDIVLFLFTRKLYPEINPEPEREIIERIRRAILSDDEHVGHRTTVLISLANQTNQLDRLVGWNKIQARKGRIEKIVNGELIGQATQDAIAASQAAMAAAMMLPVIMFNSH